MAAPKRSAPGSSSQPAKKAKASASTSQPSSSKPAAQEKRKQPLTSSSSRKTLEQEEADLDGGDWEDDDEGSLGPLDEEDDEILEEDGAGDDADMDGGAEGGEGHAAPTRDPAEKRAAREAQKVDRLARRNNKPNAQVLQESKALWAKINRKEGAIAKKERDEALQELMKLLEGRMSAVVNKHDGGRVVQSIVKQGTKVEREKVGTELKGRYLELIQAKYSKFLVLKLIRVSPASRAIIFPELIPHVPRLINHREASGILEDAYALWCTAKERTAMMRQFWGKEMLLWSDNEGKGIEGFIESEKDESRRARIADVAYGHLNTIFDNPEKGAIQHSMIHRLLRDYLTISASLPDNEKRREAFFNGIQEILPEIVHTRDGAFVARDMLAQAGAKDRKQIVKVFRPHVMKMAEDAEAQTVLMTMFDVIDDTKLVGKSIIGELNLAELFVSKLGRRVPLYLLVPRTKRHFTPATTNLLAFHDAARAKTSKKETATRQAELRKAVSPGLIEVIVGDSEGELIRDAGACLLMQETLLYAEDVDKMPTISSLVAPVARPYKQSFSMDPDPTNPAVHVIDLSWAARLYKLVFQAGHYSMATKTIDVVPGFEAYSLAFAEAFWKAVEGAGTVVDVACGGGAFVMVELIERLRAGESPLLAEVKKTFAAPAARKRAEESKAKGSKLFLEKLNSL